VEACLDLDSIRLFLNSGTVGEGRSKRESWRKGSHLRKGVARGPDQKTKDSHHSTRQNCLHHYLPRRSPNLQIHHHHLAPNSLPLRLLGRRTSSSFAQTNVRRGDRAGDRDADPPRAESRGHLPSFQSDVSQPLRATISSSSVVPVHYKDAGDEIKASNSSFLL